MTKKAFEIREIEKKDDEAMAKVIRKVLIEMGVPKVGTAYEDRSLDRLYDTYNTPRSFYFLLGSRHEIFGGAGIAPLENYDDGVCELQKMYFLPEVRGKGWGAQMMDVCLSKAKALGFKKCYLETLPYMEDATKLYAKSGFEYLEAPLGNTGHYSCTVWMLKSL